MRQKHKHSWKTVLLDGVGQFEKQNGYGGTSTVYCRGRIEECLCGIARIVPDNPRLQAVEVEREALRI